MSRECRYTPKNCEICGREFIPSTSTAKTCSEECSRKLRSQRASERWSAQRAARLEASKAKCVVCGKDYYRKNRRQVCCSLSCASSKKALDARRIRPQPENVKPGAPGYLPLTAAEAEHLRRRLGYESYGKASAAAMSRGQTLTQFLTIEAAAAGINLEKEAIT